MNDAYMELVPVLMNAENIKALCAQKSADFIARHRLKNYHHFF